MFFFVSWFFRASFFVEKILHFLIFLLGILVCFYKFRVAGVGKLCKDDLVTFDEKTRELVTLTIFILNYSGCTVCHSVRECAA